MLTLACVCKECEGGGGGKKQRSNGAFQLLCGAFYLVYSINIPIGARSYYAHDSISSAERAF